MSGGGVGTVIGGVAGAFVGGPAGAAIGASLGGTIDGSIAGAEAAAAQGRISEAQLAEQRETRRLAMAAAEPSAQEIAALETAANTNAQDIARKEKILASTDPAIIEAGRQALSLLQGTEASTLNPIRNQRAKERLKLEEQLKARLGSGYKTSTAGIQALTAFDEATNNALGTAQQNSLNSLLGVAQNSSAAGLTSNVSAATSLAGLYGNQSSRMVNAINGTPITAAGAENVAALQTAKNNQQTAQNLVSLAGIGAGAWNSGSATPTGSSVAPGSGTSYLGQNYSDFGL